MPLPFAVLLLMLPPEAPRVPWIWLGVGVVSAAELVRLWAVRHIGAVSRTRSNRLGPLVSAGPFALVRNPLYVANIGLWAGFAFSARLPFWAPIIVIALAAEYHAIVRWEELLLLSRLGEAYRTYAQHVPRWVPAFRRRPGVTGATAFPWRDTFFSERGTLVAIAVGFLLLWLKSSV